MGFSTIGAGVVIFVGLLAFAGTLTNHMFEAQREYSGALEDDRTRDEQRRHTSVAMVDGRHSSGILHLNVTNSGDSVLDVTRVALLLDGDWSNDDILTSTVDAATTEVWAPGQVLYLTITSATEPNRAYVVTETGHGALWTA